MFWGGGFVGWCYGCVVGDLVVLLWGLCVVGCVVVLVRWVMVAHLVCGVMLVAW